MEAFKKAAEETRDLAKKTEPETFTYRLCHSKKDSNVIKVSRRGAFLDAHVLTLPVGLRRVQCVMPILASGRR
jgi:hypothetical protein